MKASRPGQAWSVWSLLKVAATAAWLLLAPWAWIPATATKARTLVDVQVPLFALLYVVVAGLGIVSVVIALFLRSRWLRWALVSVFLLGFGADHLAVAVQGEPLYDPDAGDVSRGEISGAAGGGGVLAEHPGGRGAGRRAGALAAAATTSVARPRDLASLSADRTRADLRDGRGLYRPRRGFPCALAVPAQAYFAQRETDVYIGPRDAVRYAGAIRPRFEKVILIVDESVRGDYVGFNEPRLDNTPFLVSQLPIPGELRDCFVVLQLLDDGTCGPALRGARGGFAGSPRSHPSPGHDVGNTRRPRVTGELFRHLALGAADVEHADLRRAALCG